MPRRPFRPFLVPALALGLAACASTDPVVDDPRPAGEIFAEGEARFAAGDYAAAAALFDDLERLHPYSDLARTAMLRSAQASYNARSFDAARLAAERFLTFFPADPEAAQAQYIIALSHYDLIVDIGRDQGETRQALAALSELINRFPDSPYAREAELKRDLALDHLAGQEMEIGRFYLRRSQPQAAINRFRIVVEEFQTTSHTAEALHRLVEAYLMLGVDSEAQMAAAVLGYNFPGSTWYASSYDLLTGSNLAPQTLSDSWMARVWRQVFRGDWL